MSFKGRNSPSHCVPARETTGVVETKRALKDKMDRETFILTSGVSRGQKSVGTTTNFRILFVLIVLVVVVERCGVGTIYINGCLFTGIL